MKNCLRIFTLLIVLSFAQLSMAQVSGKLSSEKTKALNEAAETGDEAKLKVLLKDKKLDLNAQDEAGMTVLMSAVLGGQAKIVQHLLSLKINLEVKNVAGDTALAVAVGNDQFAIARALIEKGAKVDLTLSGDEGDTLFIRAASNDTKTAELILKKNKGLLNKTNKLGETALMQSVRFGNNKSVKMLLAHGADAKLKNQAGQTALDLAKQNHNEAAVALLAKK